MPDGARSGEPNATAVELNPAQLAFLRAAGLSVLANAWSEDARLGGRGGGLFLATPLWPGSAFGASLQRVSGASFELPTGRTKLGLAYAMGGRHFSLGVSWAHLWGDTVGGLDTFDVGAGIRFADYLAFGLVAEDVGRPALEPTTSSVGATIPGLTLPRRWVAEVTFRPTGTDRVNLAVAGLHVEDTPWSDPSFRLRLAARVAPAIAVFGDAALGPHRSPAGPGAAGLIDDGHDVRVTAGLALDFSHARVAVAARQASVPGGASGGGWGFSMALHQSNERDAEAIGTAEMVELRLDGLESDRAFLARALELRALAFDRGIAGVWLEIEDLDVGPGRLEELRDLVAALRRHGKRVIAALASPSMRELYVAAACDRIVIEPAGTVTFAGLAQSATFFKGAMDRLGVRVDLVRIAEFKGAMEPFLFEEQSEPVRRNRNALLDDVFGRMTQQIAAGRGWSAERLRSPDPAGGGGPPTPGSLAALLAKAELTPEEALQAGLVDAVFDQYGREGFLRQLFGREVAVHAPDRAPVQPARWSRPRVAVVLVDGAINEGASRRLPFDMGGLVGDDSVVSALDRCRRDGSVRAVVLRINSPGGSAHASDVIARAVAKLRAAGKPVVASMGDVAASGGYYVAAPSTVILAEPSTITGSIGIYGFKIDLSGLLAKLSLKTEVYRRGAHADQVAPYRPWTDEERVIATGQIRHLYGLFLGTVAEGRRAHGLSTPEKVDEIGRGHVWTGAEGQRIGLVDEVGGVTAAIARAAELARLRLLPDENPELVVLPRPGGRLLERLIGLGRVWSAGRLGSRGDDHGEDHGDDSVDGLEPEETGDADAGGVAGLVAGPWFAGADSGLGAAGSARASASVAGWPGMRAVLRWVGSYLFGRATGFEARLPLGDGDLSFE